MPETISNTENATTQAARRRIRVRTVLGAVLAAVVIWEVTVVLLGVDLQVLQGGVVQSVGVGLVIAATAVASLCGWALLVGLERFTRRPRTIWTVVAVLLTVLSLGGPFSSATTTSTAVSLALMHLAVGAVAVVGFRRTTR